MTSPDLRPEAVAALYQQLGELALRLHPYNMDTDLLELTTATLTALAARVEELERDEYVVASVDALVSRLGAWADATFAPNGEYRGRSIGKHLEREAREIQENPRDMEELADAFHMLAHLAHQNGESLGQAILDKFAINQRRTWGEPDDDGVIEHIREPFP